MNMPPEPERWPVAIRAYAVPDVMPSGLTKRKHAKSAALEPSYFTLIFDCETFADATQSLRFGTYQIREAGALVESGLFYSPENLSASELPPDQVRGDGSWLNFCSIKQACLANRCACA